MSDSFSGQADVIEAQRIELRRLRSEVAWLREQHEKQQRLLEREQVLKQDLQRQLTETMRALSDARSLPSTPALPALDADSIRRQVREDVEAELKPVVLTMRDAVAAALKRRA